jgi:hypothetical protein
MATSRLRASDIDVRLPPVLFTVKSPLVGPATLPTRAANGMGRRVENKARTERAQNPACLHTRAMQGLAKRRRMLAESDQGECAESNKTRI